MKDTSANFSDYPLIFSFIPNLTSGSSSRAHSCLRFLLRLKGLSFPPRLKRVMGSHAELEYREMGELKMSLR